MNSQQVNAGHLQGYRRGGTEESLISIASGHQGSHKTQTPDSLPSVPGLQSPTSSLRLSPSPPYRPDVPQVNRLLGLGMGNMAPTPLQIVDENTVDADAGHGHNCGVVDVGVESPVILGDDPLSSPFPLPDTSRRGLKHINSVLDRVRILGDFSAPLQSQYADAENQHLLIQTEAVPWQNELQPWQSEQAHQAAQAQLAAQNQRPLLDPRTSRFDRMRALRERQHPATIGLPVDATARDSFRSILCQLNGFSSNYKGDISNRANRSADIPEEENASLWIVGLEAGINVSKLLGCIAHLGRTGKIWATVISDAQPEKGHAGSAAKIVFFERVGAERVKNAIEQGRLNQFIGRSVRATFNRIRSAPQPASECSRVLLVRGPRVLVNREMLDRLFSERFMYQTECVTVIEEGAAMRVLEWRFGSFRSQAQAAGMLLSREYRGIVTWAYGKDPCDME